MIETQETVGQWATDNFGRPTPLAVLRRSCDELLEAIELCVVKNMATQTMFSAFRQGLKFLDNYALPADHVHTLVPQIAEELADSAIVNFHAAAVMNVNLNSFISSKMEINRRRLWKQNPDGTGQHIDDVLADPSVDVEEESRL